MLLGAAHSIGNPGCSGHIRHDKTITVNDQEIQVQTAISPEDQQKGLGGITCIAKNEGMLFEYDQPAYYHFWMKGMQFRLDTLWLDANKKVVTEYPYIDPSTYPDTYTSYRPAKYVLELPAGEADSLGLSLNSQTSF